MDFFNHILYLNDIFLSFGKNKNVVNIKFKYNILLINEYAGISMNEFKF